MPRPRTYDDSHRALLIRCAADEMAAHGVEALSLRRLAAAAGVSTTAIYSVVGGKEALVAAVGEEAGRSFEEAQQAVVVGADPVVDLRALGRAYRRWAVEHASLYVVMFGGRVAPPEDPCAEEGMGPLIGVVARLHAEGRLVGGDVDLAALCIWAAVHGMVSLELALWPRQPEESSAAAYENLMDAVERAWVRPPTTPG